MNTITEEQALNLRMAPLTTPYSLPREQWMLDNVLEDMERGNINHAVIEFANGYEVWRSGMKLHH